MTSRPPSLSRRSVLRGLAGTIALPWLEAMMPLGGRGGALLRAAAAAAPSAAPSAALAPSGGPLRLVWMFIPNGVYAQDWSPQGAGTEWTPSPLLEPLAPIRRHLTIYSNLGHHNAKPLGDGPGDHARSAACFLTGAHPRKTDGDDISAGVSADYLAAQALRGRARLDSLELGLEPGVESGNCDSGYSCAYAANISWRTPQNPNAKETSPRALFERIFGTDAGSEEQARRRALRKSVLDHAGRDADRLSQRLGVEDRRRVDEYLEGVRELERRLQAAEQSLPDPATLGAERPAGTPHDYDTHLALMTDLMIMAMRTDSTRVATFMFANEGSNRPYPSLGIRDGHHDVSHHGDNADKVAKFRKINTYHITQYARFVKALSEVREGEGTLLDHSLVAFGGAICDGNKHDHDNLPVVIAGRGCGAVEPGRHVQAPKGTPLCNLWLSMVRHAGVTAPRLGDSTGELPLS